MKKMMLAVLCVLSFSAFAQVPTLSPNAPKDKPQTFAAKDKSAYEAAVAPYLARAKATYPAAKSRYLKGLPSGEHFYLTTIIHDRFGHTEQVFIAVQSIKDHVVKGVIANNILKLAGYHLGSRYSFPESRVIDWLISHPDGTEEGNFVGKFLDTYHPGGG